MVPIRRFLARYVSAVILLACLICVLHQYLVGNPNFYQLDAYTGESEAFRSLSFGTAVSKLWEFAGKEGLDPYDVLAVYMITNGYSLEGTDLYLSLSTYKENYESLTAVKPVEFKKLRNAYETVLKDLKYFPVPENTDGQSPYVHYDNSWGAKRTYGGERHHEGTDVMADNNERGYFPVVSMSDGTVEKIGWLEQGGWRIGIRAPGGAYLYYAHMHSYARQFEAGETVKAGQLLGYMGDSGYSTVEGTTGNFAVHLHVGIYLRTDHSEEQSVNPYWVLKFLEGRKLVSSY